MSAIVSVSVVKPSSFGRRLQRMALLAVLAITTTAGSCSDSATGPDGETSGTPGTTQTGQFWMRNDGAAATYLYLAGTVAKVCSNGTEVLGTFNANEPSMTFVISGTTLKFPLKFDGTSSLLVGVPDQGINTNTATYYVRTTVYTCTSGTGGSGGTGGGASLKLGTMKVKIITATSGDCKSTRSYAFTGTLGGPVYTAQREQQGYWFPVTTSNRVQLAGTPSFEYSHANMNKITWELWPDKGSFPTSCVKKGEATIEYDGQVKEVIIQM